jgi:hypothetical protein
VTAVARLLPRHWDGRRLLRFLTGLALIALAFTATALAASPAAEPAEPAITIITTVDTPPGTGLPAEQSVTGRVEVQNPAAAVLSPPGEQDAAAQADPVAATPAGPVAVLPVDVTRSRGRICAEARTPGRGGIRGVRGERAPPRI